MQGNGKASQADATASQADATASQADATASQADATTSQAPARSQFTLGYLVNDNIERRLLAAQVAIEGVLAALDHWRWDFNTLAHVALAE
jgi:hypothetical protein